MTRLAKWIFPARAALFALALPCGTLAAFAGEAGPPGEVDDAREGAEAGAPAEAGGIDTLFEKAVGKAVEKAKAEPARPADERLERAASAACRIIRPLPTALAVAATAVGFVLMLFGRRLFKTGIVLYFMAMLGMVGREIGERFGGAHALVGAGVGCVLGAGVALPLRAILRALVGGLTGGILAAIVMQSVTASLMMTLAAVAAGILASGVLTFFFPTPLLIAGFSLFGAVLASVGILSVVVEPVGGFLPYTPARVLGVVLAAGLGALYQSHLEDKGGDGDD